MEMIKSIFLFSHGLDIDSSYGPYYTDNLLKLGNQTIFFDQNDNLIIDNEKIKVTPGLLELIFKKVPIKSLVDQSDLGKYKKIILKTQLHRISHDNFERIKASKAHKYKNYISKLIKSSDENVVSGEGFKRDRKLNKKSLFNTPLMRFNNNKIDYKYYNNINEIVDRLKLLISSQNVGNNNHSNEIYEIIEELEKRDYVIGKKALNNLMNHHKIDIK